MATPPGVPRRRRTVGPQFLEDGRYLVGTKGGDRPVGTHSFDEGAEGLTVSTTSPRSQITAGKERLHRPPNRRHMTHRMGPVTPDPDPQVGGNEQHGTVNARLLQPQEWENPRPCRGPGAPMGVLGC